MLFLVVSAARILDLLLLRFSQFLRDLHSNYCDYAYLNNSHPMRTLLQTLIGDTLIVALVYKKMGTYNI
jgi:hypothetical protein